MSFRRIASITLLVLLSSAQLNAAVVMLTAQNAGNYTTFLGSSLHDPNLTLVANSGGFVSNSYLVFDVSTIGDTVISVDLLGDTGGAAGRVDDVEVEFNAFSGNIAQLTSGGLSIGDLENDRDYGNFLAEASVAENSPFSLSLNANAVEDINASAGLFVVTVTQPVQTGTSGFIGDSSAGDFMLTITTATAIPEPSSLIALAGLTGSVVMFRRRR